MHPDHHTHPVVAVMGLGYVGVPLAVAFAEKGSSVIAFDVDETKLEALRAGTSYIEDISDERLGGVLDQFVITSNAEALGAADAVIICVPTPLDSNREPDLRALRSAGATAASVLREGQLVVLESTTYPGTTREQLVPMLESRGLQAGTDFNVVFSPERVDPGRTDYDLRTTPKIVGGLTPACQRAGEELYGAICDTVVGVSTPEVAELSKLLENIFRSVNIALVNELAILTDRMGIDIWEVIDAAATKPYGFMRFEPGPGMGGHCLPVDPFYLSWRAREYDMTTEFIELAGKVNQQMPYYCVQRITRELNKAAKAVRGSRVVLLGVSYKAGVADIRESPSLKIIEELLELGADVRYHDPHVAELPELGLRGSSFDVVDGADLVVIVTAHPEVDHSSLHESAAVLDLRGITRKAAIPEVARL